MSLYLSRFDIVSLNTMAEILLHLAKCKVTPAEDLWKLVPGRDWMSDCAVSHMIECVTASVDLLPDKISANFTAACHNFKLCRHRYTTGFQMVFKC